MGSVTDYVLSLMYFRKLVAAIFACNLLFFFACLQKLNVNYV